MKQLFRILAFLIVAVIALVAVMGVIGVLMPREHLVTSTALYHHPIDSVWTAIADVEHSAAWRTDVRTVERLPDRNGHPVWNQITAEGNWPLEITDAVAPRFFRAVVADESQGFGGVWNYLLSTEGGATRVTIAEDGWVTNPFIRFMAKYLFGHHSAMDGYLRALGKKFGERVKPTHMK